MKQTHFSVCVCGAVIWGDVELNFLIRNFVAEGMKYHYEVKGGFI